MRIFKTAFMASAICLALSPTSYAHHSNAPHFDNSVEVTNTGVVTNWKFVNPHAYIYFDVTETDGSISSWRCETDAASSLKRRGYDKATFTIGETITITGNPAKREDNHCFFRDFTFSDGTVVNRNTDMKMLNRGAAATSAAAIEIPKAVLLGNEPDITGFWWDGENPASAGSSPSSPPSGGGMTGMGVSSDGSLPPRLQRIADIRLTPAGQTIQDKYERIYDDPALHCKISNIIDALGRDETVNEIRQNGDTITIKYGYMDYLRTVHLGINSHPDNLTPTAGGHSIGKWDGNTLVIDTVAFTPSYLNAQVGTPTSEQFRVEERLTLDETTGEITRMYSATDSTNWVDSYRGQDTYRRSAESYSPYNCETLSGVNNLRPGTPEYIAEKAKVEAGNTANSEGAIIEKASSYKALWLALLALLVLVGYFLMRRTKRS